MDQGKIGKFIAERRKAVNLTQLQLAQKLNITDRAVSKWETGLAMPDSSIMLDLCEILQISVDDLLNGKVIEKGNCDKNSQGKPVKTKTSKGLFWIEKSVPVMMGIVAFIVSFFTYGANGYFYEAHSRFDFSVSRKLIYFLIGGGKLYGDFGDGAKGQIGFLSGISFCGFLALVLLVAAIILYVVYVFKKSNKCYLLMSLMLIVSGILILFIVDNGATVSGDGFGGFELYEVFGDHHLGAGTIVWCVLCALGGAFGVYQYFGKVKRCENNNKKHFLEVKDDLCWLIKCIPLILGIFSFISIIFIAITGYPWFWLLRFAICGVISIVQHIMLFGMSNKKTALNNKKGIKKFLQVTVKSIPLIFGIIAFIVALRCFRYCPHFLFNTTNFVPKAAFLLFCGVIALCQHGVLCFPKIKRIIVNNVDDKKTLVKSKENLNQLLKFVPIVLGVSAFFLSILTVGAGGVTNDPEHISFGLGEPVYEYRKLIDFILGGGLLYRKNTAAKQDLAEAFTGISYFGMVALICLITSIVLFIIYNYNKKSKFYLVSSILLILSGISILFILVGGSNISKFDYTDRWPYEMQFKNFKLGAGTIVWCALCVLGGAFGVCQYFGMQNFEKRFEKI